MPGDNAANVFEFPLCVELETGWEKALSVARAIAYWASGMAAHAAVTLKELAEVMTGFRVSFGGAQKYYGKGRAVLCSTSLTCAGVREGSTESMRETTPDTWGVAWLVPW